ncbi:hypothetical protein K504DRAFT_518657, partial [Pleomassaria siparia CBS 279.74]
RLSTLYQIIIASLPHYTATLPTYTLSTRPRILAMNTPVVDLPRECANYTDEEEANFKKGRLAIVAELQEGDLPKNGPSSYRVMGDFNTVYNVRNTTVEGGNVKLMDLRNLISWPSGYIDTRWEDLWRGLQNLAEASHQQETPEDPVNRNRFYFVFDKA